MRDDIITIYENNIPKEYKLLMIIDKDFNYIIYTDKENTKIDKDLYVAKVTNINDIKETLPINEDEWKMIEEEYFKVINL